MFKPNLIAIFLIALFAIQTQADPLDPDQNPLFYIGCYNTDDVNPKTPFIDIQYDVTSCRQKCLDEDFDFAGVEHNGNTCYCSDSIPLIKIPEYLCQTPCNPDAVDGSEMCGGFHTLSLYQTDDTFCPGGACTVLDFEQCYDKLGELNIEDVSTQCTAFVENDFYFYTNDITLSNFVVDGSCTSMTLSLEDQEIPLLLFDQFTNTFMRGQASQNTLQNYEGFFDPIAQTLGFTIAHGNMEDEWGCEFEETQDYFKWQCDYSLNFYFLGVQQFEYKCTVEFLIQRDVQRNGLGRGECAPTDTQCQNQPPDPPEIVEIPDTPITVEGDCCYQELTVYTSLYFCVDNTSVNDGCLGQTNTPQVFERNIPFYIKHQIDTEEFDQYFLEKVQVNIGYFVTPILDWDDSNPGYIIYKIQSNVAFDTKVITAYSLLVHPDDKVLRRRVLAGGRKLFEDNQDNKLPDDAFFSASNQVLVINDDQNKKEIDFGQVNKEEDGISPVAIGVLSAGISVFVLGVIGAAVLYIRKKKKGEKIKKFELESQRSSIKDNMSQSCKESQRNIKQSSASDLEKVPK